MSIWDQRNAPLLLHARDQDSETIDSGVVEDLIRAEMAGAPSVLWATRVEDLAVPVAAVVTHVAVPTTAEPAFLHEIHGRFGPERVLTATDPEEACATVHAQREADRARREAERARAAAAQRPRRGRLVRRVLRRLRPDLPEAGR